MIPRLVPEIEGVTLSVTEKEKKEKEKDWSWSILEVGLEGLLEMKHNTYS